MAHASHADDTTFIIAEPDFRFTKDEAESMSSWWDTQCGVESRYAEWDEVGESLPVDEQAAFRRDLNRWVAAQKLDQNASWPSDAEANPTSMGQASEWDHTYVDWGETVSLVYSRPEKPPVSAFKPERISHYLHDLQALFTAASRVGRAGFGWCGWSAAQWGAGNAKTRFQSPASGAHLSMMTAECARKLLPLWLVERDTHMGHFFATRLGLEWQHYLGSSYLWPPVGGYWSHTSTTCSDPDNPRPLNHHFDHKWSQEGTRVMNQAQQHRWICEFTKKGHCAQIGDSAVQLPEMLAELYWRTQPPPGTPAWMCGLRFHHLGLRVQDMPATRDRGFQTKRQASFRVEPLATLSFSFWEMSGCRSI